MDVPHPIVLGAGCRGQEQGARGKRIVLSLLQRLWRESHSLRYLDTEQRHTILNCLCHVLGDEQSHGLLLLGVGTKDAMVVIELVKLLGQLVAVVGDATRRIVGACLLHGCRELAELLDEVDLLGSKG